MKRLGVLLLVVASCRERDAAREPLVDAQRGILATTTASGESRAVRIDGNIERDFPAILLDKAIDWIVVTGTHAGADQCRVLVLDPRTGQPRTDYRPRAGASWTPEPTLMWPRPELVHLHEVRGQKYLSVVSIGATATSSFALLEGTARGLVERFVFWNLGHIHGVFIQEPWLVLYGVNNSFRTSTWGLTWYSPVMAVFRTDRLTTAPVCESPVQGRSKGSGFELYLVSSSDRRHGMAFNESSTTIVDGVLTTRTASQLIYTVNLRTREVDIDASATYAREYEERRLKIPGRPTLPKHLEELRRSLDVMPR